MDRSTSLFASGYAIKTADWEAATKADMTHFIRRFIENLDVKWFSLNETCRRNCNY
jgi:hypothetical protein